MATLEGNTAIFDLEVAISHLSYDDMISFADYVAHEAGIFHDQRHVADISHVTIEDFARAIRGYASVLEGVRKTR